MINEEKRELIDIFIPNESKEDVSETSKLQKLMDFDVPDKGFEEKIYIVLYRIIGSTVDDFDGLFDVCKGRTETYETIKNHFISGMDIDIHNSKIITETKLKDKNNDKKYFLIPFDECISIYAFFNSVTSYYGDDEFSIEDYNVSKTDNDSEETYQRSKEQKEFEENIIQSLKDDKFSISFASNDKSATEIDI